MDVVELFIIVVDPQKKLLIGGVYMQSDTAKIYEHFPFLMVTYIYIATLYLFLTDFISSFFFVNILFLMGILFLFFLMITRKTAILKRPIIFSTILSFFLFIYELPIIQYEQVQYSVTTYHAPEELIQGSGIFLLPVINIMIKSDKILPDLYNQTKVYEVIPATNYIRYRSKNTAIFEWIGVYNNHFEQMSINVNAYLQPSNTPAAIDDFLARDNSGGNSAGLALVLSTLVEQGKLQNEISVGVTGAISKRGKVTRVGSIKEKVQIANTSGFTHIIVPNANLSEANEVKKTLNLPIEIIGVRDVEDAINQLQGLNNN